MSATQRTSGAAAAANATITMIAANRAIKHPTALAYTYLADGGTEGGSFTYAQLDARAREIAAQVLQYAQPGDRAVLVYETGVDFVSAFFGCLYAGVIAVPIPAPEASRLSGAQRRIKSVVEDCGAKVLLGNPRSHELLRESDVGAVLQGVRWLDTQQSVGGAKLEELQRTSLDSVAYLQYTSGSTTSPKGVVLTHANIVGHLSQMQRALGYDASSVSVCWIPHFHDYALIEGFLLPMFNGTPSYFMSPFAFLKRPSAWLKAISKYRATHSQAPDFAFRYCGRRISDRERADLDLSSWRSAGNGAEPIHPSSAEIFSSAFASCGLQREAFRPAYGLAEATLMVSALEVGKVSSIGRFSSAALERGEVVAAESDADATLLASCGVPLPETDVAIVDAAKSRRLGEDRVGEVWVRSPGVAIGYWNKMKESDDTFHATIAGEDGKCYLRTGDLGFLHKGNLYITARLKDLIIIRGSNYSPQDIEWTAQHAHDALRPDHGAAFSINAGGEEKLCLVHEIERAKYSNEEFEQVRITVSQAIANEHGVPVHALVFIKRGSLPKTSSGKVQRQVCRQMYLEGSLKEEYGWKAAEASVAEDKTKWDDSTRADALLAWLREYAETRINSRLIDERRCVPPHIILDLGNRGLFGLQAPLSYGGLDLSHAEATRVYQQLGAIDLTLAIFLFLHNTNGILPILRFAPAKLQDELMPALAQGREIAAFALSEPVAGSNLGALETVALLSGAGTWKLRGVKRWNGSAWSGVTSVFARIPDGEGKLRGLTGFVVGQGERGIRIGPESLTMGVRGIMQNSLVLEDVEVGNDRLLGETGKGLEIVEYVLSRGRLATAGIALGAMQRCAQLILRYVTRRSVETGILLENPQTQIKSSELMHRIALTHETLQHVAAGMDSGKELEPEVAMYLKVFSTDSLNFAADLLMQTLGGRGYMENNLAPQIFRDARLLSIGEGANEVMVAAIGRSLRLAASSPAFLRESLAAADLARFEQLKQQIADLKPPAALRSDAAPAWRDWLYGRLICETSGFASATRLDAKGNAAVMLWAKDRMDAFAHEIAAYGVDGSTLGANAIRATVRDYMKSIGDLEPLAADVDYELDPLLKRDAPTKVAMTQNVDKEELSSEEKRRRLREILSRKKE